MKKAKKEQANVTKQEAPLQAVIFADSFTKTFRPITLERPKALLPLVGMPMLEYTIEFLTSNNVQEVLPTAMHDIVKIIIICVRHATKIAGYINSTKSARRIAIQCVNFNNCTSAGDCLRSLDKSGLVRSDPFILISGDVVARMNLSKALSFHKEVTHPSGGVMTSVFKSVSQESDCRPRLDDLVIGIDEETRQIVYFEDSITSDKFDIPRQTIMDHAAISFHNNLIDCFIDICSLEVLLRFSDNFDYQHVRHDFIRNEVSNWEVGCKIFVYHLLSTEYAARVHDLHTYDIISQDLLARWLHPLVLESQSLGNHHNTYRHCGNHFYREDDVHIPRSTTIRNGLSVGSRSCIGDAGLVDQCVIGRNVTIGNGCKLFRSYIWDDSVIGDHVSIEYGLVCGSGCNIGHGAKINRGCVISYGVTVPPNAVLDPFTRLTRIKTNDGVSPITTPLRPPGTVAVQFSPSLMPNASLALLPPLVIPSAISRESSIAVSIESNDGLYHNWKISTDDIKDSCWLNDDDDEDDNNNCVSDYKNAKNLSIDELIEAISMGGREMGEWRKKLWPTVGILFNRLDDDDMGIGNENDKESLVYDGFVKSVSSLISQCSDQEKDGIIMEIKALKFAQNRSFNNCLSGLYHGIIAFVFSEFNPATSTKVHVALSFKRCIISWRSVLKSFQLDENHESIAIKSIEEECAHYAFDNDKEIMIQVFPVMLKLLLELEVVSKDAIVAWIESHGNDEEVSEKVSDLYNSDDTQEFVDWIQEEDDEDDDDDDN